MPNNDIFAERGRSLEEEYFRKKDRELVEKMRQAAAAAQTRAELGARIGVNDPQLLEELEALGFTPDTVALLPLVPVVQVAWAEGGVSAAERNLIVKLARARGIAEGSAADLQLADWLNRRPAQDVFSRATRLISAMLAAPGQQQLSAEDLVKHCEAIASASGGMFGINRVSAEERQLLSSIADALKGRAT
jgi:tellurite resistance protein